MVMKYKLSPSARSHLLKHFDQSGQSGSHFNTALFPHQEALLTSLETMVPHRVISQSYGREAHVYMIPGTIPSGWLGIGKREDYPDSAVLEEPRNGFPTEFIYVNFLPETFLVTVIADCSGVDDLGMEWNLITAFPGDYAPAFPHQGMSKDDFNHAKLFWQEHILLKIA